MPQSEDQVALLTAARDNLPPGFEASVESTGRYITVELVQGHAFFGGVEDNPNQLGGDWPAGPGRATYASRLESFLRWVEDNDLIATEDRHGQTYPSLSINTGRRGVRSVPYAYAHPNRWRVYTTEAGATAGIRRRLEYPGYTCPYCEEEHPFGTIVCPTWRRIASCSQCQRIARVALLKHDLPYTLTTVCGTCSAGGQCQCGEPLIQYGWNSCDECASHATCVGCSVALEWFPDGGEVPREYIPRPIPGRSRPVSEETLYVCEACVPQICERCDNIQGQSRPLTVSSNDGTRICDSCATTERRNVIEIFDAKDLDDADLAEMPSIPGREAIRLCGIEIEGGNQNGGPHDLIYALRNLHLTTQSDLAGYHHTMPNSFVTVQHDSSVDWEAVIGPLNMADPDDVKKLNQTTKAIQNLVHQNILKFDLRCGLHIHISAERVGLTQAYNLSHIYTYIEDLLFRIGAARWPVHRAMQGNDACRPVPKYLRKTEFFRYQGGEGGSHDDHYFSLSFQNYFKAMLSQCGCGARQNGFWDECTCSLKKCTFEFRLFNTTANRRKLLAYLALCQALVAKAIELPEVKSPALALPGLPFTKTPLKSMSDEEREALCEEWIPRIRYIMSELPLTNEERSAIKYCMLHSEVSTGLGDETISQLCDLNDTVRKEVTV